MTEAKVTEPESGESDTADPPTQTTLARNDAPAKRPWWKKPAGAATATIVLTVIAVGGYFTVNAFLTHTSQQTTSQSTIPTVAGLPPGAAPCPPIDTAVPGRFNAGARGTPMTSCDFVEQVRKEYLAQGSPSSGPAQLRVFSPATSQWYDLACLSSGDYVTCTGGAAAVVYLYTDRVLNRQG
ncbi:MAG: hypothetical protein ACRDTN_12145 [Mycobacterium sp.]